MKRVALVLLAAAVYVASWFWDEEAVTAATARPWPQGLGTLAAAPHRYPPQHATSALAILICIARIAVVSTSPIPLWHFQAIGSRSRGAPARR